MKKQPYQKIPIYVNSFTQEILQIKGTELGDLYYRQKISGGTLGGTGILTRWSSYIKRQL